MQLLQNSPNTWLLVLAAILLAFVPPASARSVVDATGRTVEMPDRIEHVMPAGQPAAVLIFTLAPDKMIGWPHGPSSEARAFLDAAAAERPELPPLLRDGKIQAEQIRAAKPDLIIDYGSTSPRYVQRAIQLQDETGVPVLLLDGKLERTPEIYRLLGPIFETDERASDLADAANRLLAMTQERTLARHDAGKIGVYYARSADGLTTATSASLLGDVLRLIGVRNVSDSAAAGPGELTHVSRDQIYAWNPDTVVTNNPDFWTARDTPDWRELAAIGQGRLYLAPTLPFGWIDEPPSVNRLLGLLWAEHVLYPALYPDEMTSRAGDFYRRFYRVEVDGEQLRSLSR
jgi:iron complex transport system substrate-binding protein